MTARLALAAALAVAISGCADVSTGDATSFAGCEAYRNRSEAQRAWERAGAPERFDGDRDHRVCEALTRSAKRGDRRACRRVRRAIAVRLSVRRYPATADHIADAIAAGHAQVLHIDRAGADANRERALAGVPTRPGYDRDEWPMAASRESSPDSDVRYVPSADNRGAGAVIGEQLEPWCDGQAFRVKLTGRPGR